MLKIIPILLVLPNILLMVSAANETITPVVVNGENSTIDKIPYQVSLRYSGYHFCGGSIITKRYIVTAAHCMLTYPCNKTYIKQYIRVVAGQSTSTGGTEIAIADCACHENYDKSTMDFDIALLKLIVDLILGSTINVINLPAVGCTTPVAGTLAKISGYGLTSEGGSLATVIQTGNVTIIDHAECKKNYFAIQTVTSNMCCAGFLTIDGKRVDTCQGDSGGPLVVGSILTGITSWGRGCAREGYPGVYTAVCKFAAWCRSKMTLMG